MHSGQAAARWRAAALVASIVGAAASSYLLVEYLTGQPGVCLTGSGCDLVRASAFAYPLGIPMPLVGLVFYLGAIWLSLRTPYGQIAGVRVEAALLSLAVIGSIASLILTTIEAFVIRAFCSWCLVQAAAGLALLFAALLLIRAPLERVEGWSSRTRHQATRLRDGERASLRRTGWVGGGVAALAVAVLLVVGAAQGAPIGSHSPSGFASVGGPRLGSGPVEVVEFADFQCPGCAVVAPILAGLAESNEMTLVYRYFPLDSIHPNADRSARAAAAADRQGSFWAMSALLYARQNAWKELPGADADAAFLAMAGELGLDTAHWKVAYGSAEIAAEVDADRQAATAMGLNSTPTLFVAGTRYTGPLTAEGIHAALSAAR
ncbi:MAG TPA: vitamin K epoxide reductase family protein [Methylomirabilota bacterium]|nr:vitamin K epoxide reductase family protein [Methylomirabilota bacterium]